MIALAFPERLERVVQATASDGGEVIITRKTVDGVRVEE